MADRLQIEIAGTLPEEGKYAIIAAAEAAAKALAAELSEEHGVALTVSVRAVRPGKKAPVVEPVEKAAAQHHRNAAE